MEEHDDEKLITEEKETIPTKWQQYFPDGYYNELKAIIKLAIPLILVQLFQVLMLPLAVIYNGQLGKTELDAAALAVSLINVTCISVSNGMATACDTVFSQVYGSPNRLHMGVCVQRALLIFALTALPIWAFHINAESFLLIIHINPEIARLAGRYLIIFIPGTLSNLLYLVFAKYLQTQDRVIPNVIIGAIANVWNAGLHYFLMCYFHLGTTGSAISLSSSYVLMLLLMVLYVKFSHIRVGTWEGGWSWDALINWKSFGLTALFGFLMNCLEWWSFEGGLVVAGALGTTELAAQTVIFQYEMILFMVPFGVSIAVSIRTGQFLGAGEKDRARSSGLVGLSLIFIIDGILAILIVVFKDYMPFCFTNDEEAVALASDVLWFLAMFTVFDGPLSVMGGILKGCGLQWIGAIIVGGSHVLNTCIYMPIMLHTRKIEHFWVVVNVEISVKAIIYCPILARLNWSEQVEMAMQRATEGKSIIAWDTEMRTYSDDNSSTTENDNEESTGRKLWPFQLASAGFVFSILAICVIIRIGLPPEAFQDDSNDSNQTPNVTSNIL